jgi:hypothetical protein
MSEQPRAAMLNLTDADPEVRKMFAEIRAAMIAKPDAREIAMGRALYKAFQEWCAREIGRIDGLPVVMDAEVISFVVR